MSVLLKDLIIWPDRKAVGENLPSSFSSFKNCVCIIDWTEIFFERPQNQLATTQVYSNYKSHNTVKYLIGLIPAGAVSCLFYGWGECASDKMITLNSGFLEMVSCGDSILVAHGFLIEEQPKNPSFHMRKKNSWQLEMLICFDELLMFGYMLSVLLGNSRNLKYWGQLFLYV